MVGSEHFATDALRRKMSSFALLSGDINKLFKKGTFSTESQRDSFWSRSSRPCSVCVCVCVCVCVPTVLQGRSRLVIQSQVRKKGSLNVCPHQPGIRMAAAGEHGASITRGPPRRGQRAPPFSFPPWREQHKTTTLLSLHQPRRIAMATDPNYNLHSSKGTINSFPRRGVIATVSSACSTRRKAKYSFRFFLGRKKKKHKG